MKDPRIPKLEEELLALAEKEQEAHDQLLEARLAVVAREAAVATLLAQRTRLVERMTGMVFTQTLMTAVEEATGVKKAPVGQA
jgi:uncharacterized membrane protein